MVRREAIRLASLHQPELKFTGSSNWVDRFLRQNKLTLRKKTNRTIK